MKKSTFVGILAATLMVAAPAFAKSLNIDPAASHVRWLGKKVTGQHTGTIALKAGNVELDKKGALTGGTFEIDMTTIADEDLKDDTYNKKLVGHLKSDDFFSVEKNPTSKFVIKSVKALKDSKDATHEITGDLTIKGHTESVTFPAKVEIKDGKTAKAQGKMTIDRTKYGIKYGSGKFFENLGDKMINDTFELDLDLSSKI